MDYFMTYHLDIQHASEKKCPVSNDMLYKWVEETLKPHQASAELTIRIVDPSEITELNHIYRKKNQPTNVLAFPSKDPIAHWAHIVIHGVLHLLGYDHITDPDSEIMQSIEITTLSFLGFDNPYEI